MKIKNNYHKKLSFHASGNDPFSIDSGEVLDVDKEKAERALKSKWIVKEEEEELVADKKEKVLIDDLDIEDKVKELIKKEGCNEVSELTKMSKNDIKKIDGIGEKRAEEIINELNKYN
ncbi:MAG: DNA-directed RNA polymerase subunit alpha C-terminal domain-containing protein [archaeon]